jgi:hypothetical protein
LSEFCRQVLLEAAAGPPQAPEAEVILSEILALGKIVINLLDDGRDRRTAHILYPAFSPSVVIQRSGSPGISKSRSCSRASAAAAFWTVSAA